MYPEESCSMMIFIYLFFIYEMGSSYIIQAALNSWAQMILLLSVFQVAGTAGLHHCTWLYSETFQCLSHVLNIGALLHHRSQSSCHSLGIENHALLGTGLCLIPTGSGDLPETRDAYGTILILLLRMVEVCLC